MGDREIADLARRQHGLVARRQLRKLGFSSGAIGRRVRSGRLHAIHPGVYAVGHPILSRESRWMAAVLFCGPEAVLSHRSAAALWGLRHPIESIEVTTPAKSRSRSGLRRHFTVLLADEVAECDRIPVTTVPRTLFDLAATEPVDRVEHALRESERLRLHDALSLEDLLKRYPGGRGSRTVRTCLCRRRELPAGVTRRELERRFLAFLVDHGLPRPRLNAWINLGGRRYQLDCLWRERKVFAELDGYETHGTWSAFQDDRDRDRRLLAAGYRGPRVTWRHLHEIPDEIAADLREILGLRIQGAAH